MIVEWARFIDARRFHKPERARELIQGTGLTQSEVGARLGIDARTVRRYANGEAPMPYPIQVALEALQRGDHEL